MIANNTFDGFVQGAPPFGSCAIFFDNPSSDNLVTGNVFSIPSKATGDDGVCGPNESSNKVTTDNLAIAP